MVKRKKAEKGSPLINIFSNNKIVIIISFVLAVIIWFTYSATVAPDKQWTIEDVPVTIDLKNTIAEQLGLEVYGYEDVTLDVKVSGKGYVVGELTEKDVAITVQNINKIDDAGYKTLQLSAHSVDGSFDVTSISPSYIEVYFDFPETREFEVVHNVIEPEGGVAADGYHYSGAVYSANKITINGPKAELDKISEVVAETVVNTRLTKTTSITANLNVRTIDGQTPKFISYDDSQVKEVSLSIQKTKPLKFMAEFEGAPEFYVSEPLSVKYSKSEVLVAGTDSQITSLAYFEVGPIKFSEISPTNNIFEFDVKAPNGITVIDNTEKLTVTVDMSNFAMEQFSLGTGNITVKNLPTEYSVESIGFVGSVQIVAPKGVIDSISSGLITATIDLAGVSLQKGGNEVELTVGVRNRNDCWAYGTYTTIITLN
ncbi:MAG: hypothetical protein IKU25_02920 [Clostridia bacterium]|nr:hypothetical protein [Clostridia bacterium]